MTRKVSKATIKFAKFKVIKIWDKNTNIVQHHNLQKVIIATRKIRCFMIQKCCYFNNPVFWDSRRLTYYPNVIFCQKEKAEKTSLTSI